MSDCCTSEDGGTSSILEGASENKEEKRINTEITRHQYSTTNIFSQQDSFNHNNLTKVE